MSVHRKTATLTIEASPEEVWRVLADDFVRVSEWGPGVLSSGPNPATPYGVNGSAAGGRVCMVEGLGKTDERIVGYDGVARSLRYTIQAEGFPSFIEGMENTWIVSPDGPDRSIVNTDLVVTIADSMPESEAAQTFAAMFAGAGGAISSLKAFVEQ